MNIISPKLENGNAVVNGPKVGDILVSCSGYEASIAHFAKVVGVSKASVKIVRLGCNNKYTGGGGMTWDSTPDLNAVGKTETKRFKAVGESYRVKDTSYANFYVWGGEPVSCYNYH
jgi:hypothetical protein